MSHRTDREIYSYGSARLMEIVEETDDFDFSVSGINMNVRELANAGWSCRIAKNPYGGRIKVSFFGKDKKSILTFRLPRYVCHTDPRETFKYLHEGTLTQLPKNITVYEDQDLLEQVERNIKDRLKFKNMGRPKKRAKSTVATEQRIEQVMGAGAA